MTVTNETTPGRRIAAIRESRGWKQAELAKKAGISVTYLSELENDKRSMRSDTLLRLADALGTSIDYLLKGRIASQTLSEPLVIPPELMEAANEHNWSVRDAQDLLKANQIVLVRRSRTSSNDQSQRSLTKEGWVEFYQSLFNDD